ncbi:MAG: hypothetical protein WC789_08435 [Lentisphaeria bacterium]|jgi:hypothetical protein
MRAGRQLHSARCPMPNPLIVQGTPKGSHHGPVARRRRLGVA